MDETKKSPSPAEPTWSRRKFLGAASTAAAGIMVVPRHVIGATQRRKAPSDTLNIACVGVGGMGFSDTRGVRSENIVALCDVDDEMVARLLRSEDLEPKEKAMYDKAAKYRDFRRMLEKEKGIDALTVTTPDHNHAVIAMAAIKLGKHVYVQKPLTHTIKEARLLAKAAKEANVVTQMGNQGHSKEGARLICEWIWDGAIGDVFEAHCWTNRPIWPQGIDAPERDPVGAVDARLGRLARPGAVPALSSRLPSLQVARPLGLRHRGPRRHGRPHHGPAFLGPQAQVSRSASRLARRRIHEGLLLPGPRS